MCGETCIFALQLVLQRACPFLLQGSSLPFSHYPLEPLNRSCKIQDVLGKAELSLQQFSLRVYYFTRKQTGLFRGFKFSYNDHTYYHISFFFYRCCHPLKIFVEKLGPYLPIHTLCAATLVFFYYLKGMVFSCSCCHQLL